MSEITIKEVSSRQDLKRYIRFNYDLYKDNPCAVPDFLEDTLDTFDPKKNAAFDFCEAIHFLAYRGDKVVGRVTGIINHKANQTWNQKCARFGWIDFVDDPAVSAALLKAVEDWGRSKGMDELEGPLGFTDMDPEGMLIEGFDQLGTMATIYNYPYYKEHMERHGYFKATDWVERKIKVPYKDTPADSMKFFRVAEMSRKRYNLHIKKLKNMKEVREGGYGQKMFDLINEAYAPLFGYSAMNERQIASYVDQYLPLVDLDLVTVIETAEGEVVAVGITMPSLSRAVQRAKARMWPFGWIHMAWALFVKHSDITDLLLIAVKPEYQNRGVNALLFADLIPRHQRKGYHWAESHPQLETNEKSQTQWEHLDCEVHKRRRCFKKAL